MKRFTLIAIIAAAISTTACKKDSTCWECVKANGSEFGEYCDSKKVDELIAQGWTCNQK